MTPKGYKILNFSDIEGDLSRYHKMGAKAGVYLGFDVMKDFYSMKEDGITDWTGLPASGKSELLLELLFNTSEFYGWKHLLLVPDIGDRVEVMSILIHKYTKKTFDKRYPNHIDIKVAFNACTWLLEHFHIMDQVDHTASISPVEFWEFACEYKKEHGIQTATIDSWKDLRHDYHKYGGSYAQYLSNVLPIRNKLSELNNIHFHTVIHPKTPRRDSKGMLIHPQVDDMEGGAQWNNSGKVIISVHRANYQTTDVDVQILKVKPKVIGKWGTFPLNFDPADSRYYEMLNVDGGKRKYAEAKQLAAKNFYENEKEPPF